MKDQVKTVLAVLLVGALGWVLYQQLTGGSLVPGAIQAVLPPEPDLTPLADLKGVSSIRAEGVLGAGAGYDMGGRNLFQYGVKRPPPPSPAELERMRLAEEARLKAMEEEARQRAAEQEKLLREENERRAREAQEALARQNVAQATQAQAAAAAGPVKPPPPPIGLKLIGWLGPPGSRIAVLLNGKDVVLARKGETIDGKFKVLGIGPEYVEMGYADPAHEGVRKRIELGS